MLVRRLVTSLMCAALVALGSAPVRAQIPTCGNGLLNLDEECDDGNVVAGDCCTPGCRLMPANTVCRSSTAPCDAAEVCTGIDGLCPADTGLLGDGDGDGPCDVLDVCPTVPDPAQLDGDGDGVGDACDRCTNVFPGVIASPRVRIRKLDKPFGDQRLKVNAMVTVPDAPLVDPSAKGLVVYATDARGRIVFDVTVPSGAFDPSTRLGWLTYGTGGKWSFVDGFDAAPGVDKASVRLSPAAPGTTLLRIHLQSRGNSEAITPDLPFTLTVIVDAPIATGGQCAELAFDSSRCASRNRGGKIVCH